LYFKDLADGRIGEIVRPELRGTFLCTLNGSILFGQFLGVLISRGTSEIVGKWSYESLIVLQYMFPLILLLFAPWFPESAYYHLRKGETEKARKSLIRTYGSGDQDLIDCEMKRIAENVRYSEEIATAAAVHGPLIKQCFSATNIVYTIETCLIVATNLDSFVTSCSAAVYWCRFCAWMYFQACEADF
jgi:Sugar (and other) transporter